MKQSKIENFISTRYKKRIYTPSLSISKKNLVKNYSYRSSTTPKYILAYKFLSKNKDTERAKVVVSKNHSQDNEHNNLYLSELSNKVTLIERKIKMLQQEIKKDYTNSELYTRLIRLYIYAAIGYISSIIISCIRTIFRI